MAVKPRPYENVAAKIVNTIERGAFRTGDRIPSIREASRQFRLSVNTAIGAYVRLEPRT
jgi:DNA-binding transcriptional regulator YhcF (GntR family)